MKDKERGRSQNTRETSISSLLRHDLAGETEQQQPSGVLFLRSTRLGLRSASSRLQIYNFSENASLQKEAFLNFWPFRRV